MFDDVRQISQLLVIFKKVVIFIADLRDYLADYSVS